MKVYSSLKSKKVRDKDCKVVRRKGRVYVINKKNPKLKARQGLILINLISCFKKPAVFKRVLLYPKPSEIKPKPVLRSNFERL